MKNYMILKEGLTLILEELAVNGVEEIRVGLKNILDNLNGAVNYYSVIFEKDALIVVNSIEAAIALIDNSNLSFMLDGNEYFLNRFLKEENRKSEIVEEIKKHRNTIVDELPHELGKIKQADEENIISYYNISLFIFNFGATICKANGKGFNTEEIASTVAKKGIQLDDLEKESIFKLLEQVKKLKFLGFIDDLMQQVIFTIVMGLVIDNYMDLLSFRINQMLISLEEVKNTLGNLTELKEKLRDLLQNAKKPELKDLEVRNIEKELVNLFIDNRKKLKKEIFFKVLARHIEAAIETTDKETLEYLKENLLEKNIENISTSNLKEDTDQLKTQLYKIRLLKYRDFISSLDVNLGKDKIKDIISKINNDLVRNSLTEVKFSKKVGKIIKYLAILIKGNLIIREDEKSRVYDFLIEHLDVLSKIDANVCSKVKTYNNNKRIQSHVDAVKSIGNEIIGNLTRGLSRNNLGRSEGPVKAEENSSMFCGFGGPLNGNNSKKDSATNLFSSGIGTNKPRGGSNKIEDSSIAVSYIDFENRVNAIKGNELQNKSKIVELLMYIQRINVLNRASSSEQQSDSKELAEPSTKENEVYSKLRKNSELQVSLFAIYFAICRVKNKLKLDVNLIDALRNFLTPIIQSSFKGLLLSALSASDIAILNFLEYVKEFISFDKENNKLIDEIKKEFNGEDISNLINLYFIIFKKISKNAFDDVIKKAIENSLKNLSNFLIGLPYIVNSEEKQSLKAGNNGEVSSVDNDVNIVAERSDGQEFALFKMLSSHFRQILSDLKSIAKRKKAEKNNDRIHENFYINFIVAIEEIEKKYEHILQSIVKEGQLFENFDSMENMVLAIQDKVCELSNRHEVSFDLPVKNTLLLDDNSFSNKINDYLLMVQHLGEIMPLGFNEFPDKIKELAEMFEAKEKERKNEEKIQEEKEGKGKGKVEEKIEEPIVKNYDFRLIKNFAKYLQRRFVPERGISLNIGLIEEKTLQLLPEVLDKIKIFNNYCNYKCANIKTEQKLTDGEIGAIYVLSSKISNNEIYKNAELVYRKNKILETIKNWREIDHKYTLPSSLTNLNVKQMGKEEFDEKEKEVLQAIQTRLSEFPERSENYLRLRLRRLLLAYPDRGLISLTNLKAQPQSLTHKRNPDNSKSSQGSSASTSNSSNSPHPSKSAPSVFFTRHDQDAARQANILLPSPSTPNNVSYNNSIFGSKQPVVNTTVNSKGQIHPLKYNF